MTDERTSQGGRTPGWLAAILYFGAVAIVIAGIMLLYPRADGDVDAAGTVTTTTVPSVPVSNPDSGVDRPPSSSDEPVAQAAEVILPSVVHVDTNSGLGSGVIYDSSGLIITAAHVVEGSDTVRIRFSNGEQAVGEVLGTAPEVDIAVIKVPPTELPAAVFNTDKPRVGQMAIAVGSPWGLESTVTAGIISAVDQTNCNANTCSSMVQTDAAINPGNSGGALVNRFGEVVGINVSIFSSSGANDGVGFAVPAAIATAYADSIVSGEPLKTAFLGVRGANVAEGQAGAVITEVTPGSAAETAGLQVDDVVIALDGVPVQGWTDLIAQVRAHQPGETLDILLIRDGVDLTISVTLDERSEDVG